MKSWQAHSDLTIFAGYAPQENGPSEHKEHFWDHVTKTMAKLPRSTSIIFGGDFNGDPMPDDAAIGWRHPCETLTDNGAHINEICAATQLWSPVTWSAKPVPANPSWEGPDHILLSVDLTAPPVTIEFRFSRGTVLASRDHAPWRLTMQYRFRIRKQREKSRRLDRAKLAAATTDLHFAKHFIGDAEEKWVKANSGRRHTQTQAGNTWKVLFSV